MSLLGKILNMMILLMTVLFMGFSVVVHATHQNWRDIVDNDVATIHKPLGMKQQLRQAKQAAEMLRIENHQLRHRSAAEQVARTAAIAGIESRLDTARQFAADSQRALADVRVEVQRISSVKEQQSQINLTLLHAVAGLRETAMYVLDDRDNVAYENVELNNQLNQSQGEAKRLAFRRDQLIDQLASSSRKLRELGILPDEDDSIPWNQRGVVTAVGERRLLEISLGSDDGIRPGQHMHVYRGKSYRGRIQIRSAKADRAIAEIDSQYQRGSIAVDDHVAASFAAAPPL